MPRKKLDFANSLTISEPPTSEPTPAKATVSESWVDPDDAPEFTDELVERFFANAEIRDGDRIIRPGNPPLDVFKGAVTLRLDADVIEAYRSLGDDWLVRINADLRKARKLKKA